MYLPVQMGHAIHPGIGYIGDDTGENISERNGNFCELRPVLGGQKPGFRLYRHRALPPLLCQPPAPF